MTLGAVSPLPGHRKSSARWGNFCKVQAAFRPMPEKLEVEGVRVLTTEVRGSVVTFVCAAGEEQSIAAIEKLSPVFCESVGLTLEEVFIYEMEAVGYDYSKIIF